MPLASSLTSSQKRAATVKAEKEQKERRERLSLPRNCQSSTRVTHESVKRRRNSRAMSEERMSKKQQVVKKTSGGSISSRTSSNGGSKENKAMLTSPPRRKGPAQAPPLPVMSPTPYWKVAADRDNNTKFSPTLTRSAKKKKAPRNDNDSVASRGGISLAFSPPDHEKNKRLEQEEMNNKEEQRERRISKNQDSGHLQIFDTAGDPLKDLNADDDNEKDDDNNVNFNEDHNNDGWEDEPSFDSEVGFKSSSNSHISDFSSSQHRQQSTIELQEDIKTIKQTLEQVVQDRRASDAGLLLNTQVDKTALAAEQLKSKELLTEKSNLESAVSDLQAKLAKGVVEFQTEKQRLESTLDSSQQEFSQQIRDLQSEVAALQKEKEQLLEQVAILESDLRAARDMLSTNEADANVIEDLTSQLTTMKEKESEAATKLDEELQKMAEIKAQLETDIQRTESELETYKTKLDDSDAQLRDVLTKNQEQESQIQEEIQTRESSVNDLMERIEVLRDGKVESTGELDNMRGELDQMEIVKANQDKKIAELQVSFASAQKKFSKEQKIVVESLSGLKNALEASTAKVRATEDSKNIEMGKRNERIVELESQLLESKGKLENAVVRLSTSDEREGELLRKLSASDKIRAQLHNRVTQLSGNIRVFVRVRPSIPGEDDKIKAAAQAAEKPRGKRGNKKDPANNMESPFYFPGELEACTSSAGESDDITKRIIEIKEPAKDRGGLSERRKVWRFPFDNVFSSNSGQGNVWEAVAPLVQSAIDGYPTCIFAYGQTGSGKTYTMLGEPGNEGVISRAVNKMFAAKRELEEISRGSTKVEMSLELLEIYNEQVRDLLSTNGGPDGREIALKLTSQEVVGNEVIPASSEEEVMRVLALAQSRRCVKATKSNAESSRSHMVFTLHFSCTTKGGIKRVGKLNICDLAGSERLSKSGANSVVNGDLMKETKNINSSLSVLSNVIEKLQAGSNSIPYRESKLTYLLKNSLGGNSKTLAIVCCNPHAAHFHESLCSIRFAEKVNKVELKAMANFKC